MKNIALLLCTLPLIGQATIIQVTNSNNSGSGSLRDAVTLASPGDTITFAPGTNGNDINLVNSITLTADITIIGNDSSQTILNNPPTNFDRIFIINVGVNVNLFDLTITGGNGNYGAGIRNDGNLFMESCKVSENTTTNLGGGIRNSTTGVLIARNCAFIDNTYQSNDNGGGIYNQGTLDLKKCLLKGNDASRGGAIYNNSQFATIDSCVFDGNKSNGGYGGGIYNTGSITIINSQMFNTLHGHALTNYYGTAYVRRSVIKANNGGGILNNQASKLYIYQCLIDSNYTGTSSGARGGGIYNVGDVVEIYNSTISRNISGGAGGIYQNNGRVSIYHSTLTGNVAATNWGGAIILDADTLELRNNIMAKNTSPGFIGREINVPNGANNPVILNSGNIVESCNYFAGTCPTFYSSSDPLLTALQDNGGPTHTYAIALGSPAIDVADTNYRETIDQRGFNRDNLPDIGAYEYGAQCSGFTSNINTSSNYNGAVISCSGASDGAVTASVTGGLPGYQYQWSANAGSQTTATATGLGAGTYSVTVTDTSGCTTTDSITLIDPPAVTATIASSTNPTCFGYKDGSAVANGTGGTGTLAYAWTPGGGTTMTLSNMSAGVLYTCTVTDANGCNSNDTLTLQSPNPIDTSVSKAANILTANASASNYQWIDCNNGNAQIPGATSASYAAPANGNFAVIVTVGGCIDTSGCHTVTGVGTNQYSVSDGITIYPNPVESGNTIVVSSLTHPIDQFVLYDMTGAMIQRIEVQAPLLKFNTDKLASGVYMVHVHVNGQQTSPIRVIIH